MERKSTSKFTNPLFIDSGAHGIFNEFVNKVYGATRYDYYETDEFWQYVDKYAVFIKANKKSIDVFANVDAITNPEITWKVQMYLEKEHGLTPLPAVHHGTDLKWLKRYLRRGYKYIALGGIAQDATKAAYRGWADDAFNIICDTTDKKPITKIHGFAMTSHDLMVRYPWYSVDSTSWLKYGSYGFVIYPPWRNEEWKYDIPFFKFRTSSRYHPTHRNYQASLTKNQDKIFYKYIEEQGFVMGQSEMKSVSSDYKLKDDELWSDKTKGVVELIIKPGLCNNSDMRCSLNGLYFLDFVKQLPEWPWTWQKSKKTLL